MIMPLNFNFQADLPLAKIIAPYYNFPEGISIGKLLAQGEIKGNLENPKVSVEFQIPGAAATSVGQISGRGGLVFVDNKFSFTNTEFIVDRGKVTIDGIADLNGQIQATVKAREIPIQSFFPELPLATKLVTGKINIEGALDELLSTPEKVPSSLNVEADVTLAVEGGIVNATTNLNSEIIEVFASVDRVNLDSILPTTTAKVEGIQVNISASTRELFALARQPLQLGNLANLDSLNGSADLELSVGTGKINANANLSANAVQVTAITNNILPQEILPNLPIQVDNLDAQVNASAKVEELLVLGTNYLDRQTLTPISSLQLTADANLDVADGSVSVLANVQNNRWQAKINTNEVNPNILAKQLSLLPEHETLNLPNLNAQLNLAGNLESLQQPNLPLTIEAQSVALNLGENSLRANGNLTIANLFTQPDVSNLQLNVQAQSDLASSIRFSKFTY